MVWILTCLCSISLDVGRWVGESKLSQCVIYIYETGGYLHNIQVDIQFL